VTGKAAIWLPLYLVIGAVYYFATGKRYIYWQANLAGMGISVLWPSRYHGRVVRICRHENFSAAKNRDSSYGLYLWHMPVIWSLEFRWLWVHRCLLTAVAWALSLGLAAASWTLIERPALRLKSLTSSQSEHPVV
jgi:peptidoglycan/LPS O-acetylase OafA/YrhL